MREQIPIFFTIDDGYAPNMGIALYSMIQNASGQRRYKIHVIHQGLSEKNRSRIEALGNDNFEISFYEMKDKLSEITDREENRLRCDYFSLTIYFRLFIADMFPEYEKAIYVDSDIVCREIFLKCIIWSWEKTLLAPAMIFQSKRFRNW